MELNKVRISELISLVNEKNVENRDLPFYGINKDNQFMPTQASTSSLDRANYKVMTRERFVFSGMQTGRDMCIRIGLYTFDFDALVSPAYTTFCITSDLVIPEYFFMIFNSKEMDRYGAFLSDGSVRANLDWDVFCGIELLLPDVTIQRKYASIYSAFIKNSGLQQDADRTCPILVAGALSEARRQ